MKVADLFISLNLLGAKALTTGLKESREGLSALKNSSLQTKAAILGVGYGIERLISGSVEAGTAIMQFENLTGKSGETLQRWQYAMRQAGGSAEDVTASIVGLQNSVAEMEMGGAAPAGWEMFTNMMNIDQSKLKDSFYMLEKLQEFMQKGDRGQANVLGRSLHLSDKMIGGMNVNAFNDKQFRRAPILSSGNAKTLQGLGASFEDIKANFSNKLGLTIAKHGPKTMKNIHDLTDSLSKFLDVMLKLSEQLHVFEILNTFIKGLADVLGGVSDVIGDEVDGKPRDKNKPKYYKEGRETLGNLMKESLGDAVGAFTGLGKLGVAGAKNVGSAYSEAKKMVAPPLPGDRPNPTPNVTHNHIKTDIHAPSTDAGELARLTGKEVGHAVNASPSKRKSR